VSSVEPERAQRLRLVGVIVVMSFLFGNNFVALDVALRDSGPITLQAVAVSIAGLTVWLLTMNEKLPIRQMSRDTRWAIVAVSMALSVASPVLMVYGVQRVNPAVAAMIVTTAPISTLILERIVFKRRLEPLKVFGVGLGFVGVGFVVVPLGGEGASEIIGIAVLIGASFAWAVGLILTRRLRGVIGGGRFVIWQMVAALPVLYTLAFIVEGFRIEWTWSYVAAVGYSGAFAKGIASFLQFRTVRVGSPLQSSLAAFMVPAVATISTYVILRETVMAVQIIGMALIAVAVGIVIGTHRQDSSALYDGRQPPRRSD
jgi:drug/metabolite transporter (DMT)-like permease